MSEEYPDWQDGPLKVVKNSDRVCSIWPVDRPHAPGWEDAGFSGSKEACLQYVKEHCDGNCRLRDKVSNVSDSLPPATSQ